MGSLDQLTEVFGPVDDLLSENQTVMETLEEPREPERYVSGELLELTCGCWLIYADDQRGNSIVEMRVRCFGGGHG